MDEKDIKWLLETLDLYMNTTTDWEQKDNDKLRDLMFGFAIEEIWCCLNCMKELELRDIEHIKRDFECPYCCGKEFKVIFRNRRD